MSVGAEDSALRAGTVLDAADVTVPLEALGADSVVSGAPEAGVAELGGIGGAEFGLWEHTVGTSTDVEDDEVFVVLSGAATVEIEAFRDQPAVTLELRPGSIVRLSEGMHTTWTITETLRKLWIG